MSRAVHTERIGTENGRHAMARSLRSQLYRAARIMGDVEAAAKGPDALARRVVRRKAYRTSSGLTGSILRALGMQGRRR